jgi:hypothetical protein
MEAGFVDGAQDLSEQHVHSASAFLNGGVKAEDPRSHQQSGEAEHEQQKSYDRGKHEAAERQ